MKKLTLADVRTRAESYDSREFFYGRDFDSNIRKKYPIIEREAAVLVLLTMVRDEIHVVLTIRSDLVRTHRGEVAFAGGVREPSDRSPIETALREAYEEIGLPSEFVSVLACLPPIISRSRILLFPVIGLLNNYEDFTPSPNPSEVSKCFHVPLARFLSKDGLTVRELYLESMNKTIESHFFEDQLADGDTVVTFGITGFICTLVAAGLFRMKPEYPFWFSFPDDDDETMWKQAFVSLGLRYKDTLNKELVKTLTTSKV